MKAATELMTARSLESHKHQKVTYENQRKRQILGRQRDEKDYWDEYKDFSLDFSSVDSDCHESSLD